MEADLANYFSVCSISRSRTQLPRQGGARGLGALLPASCSSAIALPGGASTESKDAMAFDFPPPHSRGSQRILMCEDSSSATKKCSNNSCLLYPLCILCPGSSSLGRGRAEAPLCPPPRGALVRADVHRQVQVGNCIAAQSRATLLSDCWLPVGDICGKRARRADWQKASRRYSTITPSWSSTLSASGTVLLTPLCAASR